MKTRAEHQMSSFVFLWLSSLKQEPSLNRKHNITAGLAIHWSLGILLSAPPDPEITGTNRHAWLFAWILWTQTPILTLTEQALLLKDPLCSLRFIIFHIHYIKVQPYVVYESLSGLHESIPFLGLNAWFLAASSCLLILYIFYLFQVVWHHLLGSHHNAFDSDSGPHGTSNSTS